MRNRDMTYLKLLCLALFLTLALTASTFAQKSQSITRKVMIFPHKLPNGAPRRVVEEHVRTRLPGDEPC